MRTKKYWVYDFETIINTFIAVFEDLQTSTQHIFIIKESQNDIQKLIQFLEENIKYKDWHLGYNCLAFDSQLTEHILNNKELYSWLDGEEIAKDLYNYAQHIIMLSDSNQFLDYPEFKLKIKTIDIYKLNYWHSSVKRSSLKWIQYAMDWENVEEMPHDFRQPIITQEELDMVVSYCINDVQSTKAIYNYKDSKGEKIMISQINLRGQLSKEFNLNLNSAAEPKISKDVFLYFLSNKLGIDKKELREKRTYRDKIIVKDLILPYIQFKTDEFKKVYNWANELIIDSILLSENEENIAKKGPRLVTQIHGTEHIIAMGGLHGCCEPGVYKTGFGRIIKSFDVKSYYPNLAIKNGWHPAHIPAKAFCDQYEWFYNERLKYPKTSPLNYLFKIVLNSSYGLSKEKHCFLYDPQMPTAICINGELSLLLLYEMLIEKIPDLQILMSNTDGGEISIKIEDVPIYEEICKQWEKITQLELELVTYNTLFIADINNYIGVYDNKKTKAKGRFEFEDLPLHKNKSNLIVPKAIYNYFVNGIKPETFLQQNRNIYDYCSGVKIKGDWRFYKLSIDNGQHSEEKLHKIVRYYISNRGCKIVKRNPDGREIQTESGEWMQIIFNKYEKREWKDYQIDEKYYLEKIYKEIQNIEGESKDTPTQLSFNF